MIGWRGVPPPDWVWRDTVLRGAVRDPMSKRGLGLEPRVHRWFGVFGRWPHARMIMRRARAAAIPYSEALERWGNPDDLAAEFAWDWWQHQSHWERCPDCDVHPADVMDLDRMRRLEEPRWRLAVHQCYTCQELRKMDRQMPKDYREAGFRWRLMPAGPGDDWIESL